ADSEIERPSKILEDK
ncbi:MAG: hypothetical protein EZS28_034412, partial [Streblomastix strix]